MSSALGTSVAVGDIRKPFGELTAGEVRAHATALGEAAGFGHRSRVGAVSAAWREFARSMEEAGAERVDELPPRTIDAYVERLWVVPPGGSLLR
jgi:hypothetical protein